jgi:hypothetical protein
MKIRSADTDTHGKVNMKCLQYFVKKAPKKATVLSSETSVNISRTTRHCKPEDNTNYNNTFWTRVMETAEHQPNTLTVNQKDSAT